MTSESSVLAGDASAKSAGTEVVITLSTGPMVITTLPDGSCMVNGEPVTPFHAERSLPLGAGPATGTGRIPRPLAFGVEGEKP
jgi:hypothetical protein